MSKTFRQFDDRWGDLVYTRGGSTMAHAGCGATTEAMIIVNNPEYADADPRTTRKWLMANHYNIQGTTHAGISKGLEHFGFVQRNFSEANIQQAFDLLASGEYLWGAINFGRGKRGGVVWTSNGHYVMFSAFRVKNGKVELFTRDPGARKNDGWHGYRKTMKGLIKRIWICKLKNAVPMPKPVKIKKTYAGKFPKLPKKGYLAQGDTGKQVKRLQKFLNWYRSFDLAIDGSFGPLTDEALRKFQKAEKLTVDGKYGPKSSEKAETIKK